MMRSQSIFGLFLVLAGLILLYLFRGVFVQLVYLVIGFVIVLIALALVVFGLGMLFFGGGRSRWRRVI
jgi:hypothetical protein